MLTIKATYTTGDTLNTYENVEDELGISLSTLEEALDCLQVAKAHYNFLKEIESIEQSYRRTTKLTKKDVVEKYCKEPWFCAEPLESFFYNNQKVNAFYYGYFETLHSLEIIMEDSDKHKTIEYFG